MDLLRRSTGSYAERMLKHIAHPSLRLLAVTSVAIATAGHAAAQRPGAESKTLITHALPHANGDHLETTVIEVRYAPGAASNAHSHTCPVIGVVLEGSVRMQVRGEVESIYRAGDTFYEAPNGVHAVSANASQSDAARFLAIMVCDHDQPRTVAVPAEQAR